MWAPAMVVIVTMVGLALSACDDRVVGPGPGGSAVSFDQIAAGADHTCGLDTSTGQAYCWGSNVQGQLGDGTTSPRTAPVAVDQSVLGGISFDQIAAGGRHTCGLDTSTGQAYCWGWNRESQVGDGTTTSPRTTPVAVNQSGGGITFDQVAAGSVHTCGLDTSTGQAYCWGGNVDGQVGDGTTTSPRTTPVAVDQSGGITFDQIAANENHICGLDSSTRQAYCWGDNFSREVGDGTTTSPRPTPVAVDQSVLGGISFDQIAAGGNNACGLDTSTGQAYCWGANVWGQLGGGTSPSSRRTPVAVDQSVFGGITFDQIAAGRVHTCGLDTSTGRTFCWGSNASGQVGDGTTTSSRTTPTPVAGTGND